MKCDKCKRTGHLGKVSGFEFTGYQLEIIHCPQCKDAGEVTAQPRVQADFSSRDGIYLEPRGSHETNPFSAQDKPKNR